MIDTTKALESVVQRARAAGSVALDTEFVWEKTYYPRLGLVQMGLPREECHLVDVPAIEDLSPLGRLLAADSVEKILHDAVQDLFILQRATGACPRTVFDTRLDAGFGGLGASTSLLRLVHELLGVELSKGAQRTNWLRRPLSAVQITYAENDVRYLHGVRDVLRQKVGEFGNTEWLRQELRCLDDPTLYGERPAREQFLRVKGATHLDGRRLAVLREVTTFREQEARRRDLPRAWLFSDPTLLALARHQPATLAELEQIKGLGARAIQHRGKALLEHITRGVELPAEACPPPVTRPGLRQVPPDDLDRAFSLLDGHCEPRGIDPALVASRAEMRALLGDGPGASAQHHRMLDGWRAELVGRELVEGL